VSGELPGGALAGVPVVPPTCAPHDPQNVAPSLIWLPHFGQNAISPPCRSISTARGRGVSSRAPLTANANSLRNITSDYAERAIAYHMWIRKATVMLWTVARASRPLWGGHPARASLPVPFALAFLANALGLP